MTIMKKAQPKRIIVVLGMHRSGTSAVARGLKALGVDLGERLMPAAADNNERGFWEDIDAHRINSELLEALGRSWDSLIPLTREQIERPELDRFRSQAAELLRERLRNTRLYGLKDPRISVLLPLWKSAFESVRAAAGYVLCVRHPLSVARSLQKRDRFDVEKSHYLWLDHVVSGVIGSRGSPRVVVDYDGLMREPATQLERIARALSLDFDPTTPAFAEYERDFLSEELRHSVFAPEDLQKDPATPRDVLEAYNLLTAAARDEASLDSPAAMQFFEDAARRLSGMSPALAYMGRRDAQIASLEKDAHIANLQHAIAVKDGQIHGLNVAAAERETRLAATQQAIAELQQQVRELERAAHEKDAQISSLQLGQTSKDGQIHGLNLMIAERDARLAAYEAEAQQLRQDRAQREGQVRDLTEMVVTKDRDIANLQHALAAKDGQIHGLNITIAERDSRLAAALGHEAKVNELSQAVVAKDGQIHGLNITIAERDARLAAAQEAIAAREDKLRAAQSAAAARDERIEELQRAVIASAATERARRALEIAIERVRARLEDEAALAGGLASRLQAAELEAAPGDLHAALQGLRESETQLRTLAGSLDVSDEQSLAAWVDRAFEARKAAWERAEAGASVLSESLAAAGREIEMNRLRLLDGLREISRQRAEIAQLAARTQGLEAALGQRQAELRERERILGQFGHQFVSRVGAVLDPYPSVRWVVTAPLRLVHWILGHARA